MKNKLVISIICLLGMIIFDMSSIQVNAQDVEIMAPAKAMIVLEGNTNTVLYEYNKDARLPMASTTKVVTAILAIEKCDNLDEKIEISDKAIGIEGTSIYIKSGEKLSMRELLYGLILASGNDCAVAIAEALGGEESFVNEMNTFAKSLGLENTHFDNPHGLDSDTHYTSAYDLSVMMSYGLKNPIFRELVATERMVIEKTDLYSARYLKNKNKLLFTEENCIGGKTGFTDNAGRCLVNAHEEKDMQIISVVLNCGPMFEECQRLTNLALDNYVMKEFIKPYNFVSNIKISDSTKNEIGVITVRGFDKPILRSEIDKYQVKYNLPDSLQAPITLNEKVGTVEILYLDELIYEDDLITIEDAENNNIKYLLDNIIDRWF